MFTTKPVNYHNVSAIMALDVAPGQERFVAPNVRTVAQAAYEPAAELVAFYDDDTPIGLMAIMDLSLDSPSITEDDPRDSAYIWRLMIATGHQGKGHGTAALNAACDWARARGLKAVYVSTVPKPGNPRPFYEKNGFTFTGRMEGDEELHMRPL